MPIENRRQEFWQKLKSSLEANQSAELAKVLSQLHAADLAEFLPEFERPQQIAILDALSDEQAAELLDELTPEDRANVLDLLSLERASDILEEMPTDEAADLLGELSSEEADTFLQHMEPEVADDVADLLRYSEDVAGGLMAKEFVRIDPDQTVGDILALLRQHHDDAEMIYYLYVLDEEDRLLGVVTLRKLIVSEPQTDIADIMAREFISVPVNMPQDEVAEIVRRHDLLAVPVLDHDGRMQGMITVDDIGDVVQEEASENLLEMSGSEEIDEESRTLLALRSWRSGLLALVGGVITTVLIWIFSQSLTGNTGIVTLLPLLLVLSITAGSQAAIAMDRSYENAVERQQTWRIFLREIQAGGILAIIGAVLAGLLAVIAVKSSMTKTAAIVIPFGLGLWCSSVIGVSGVLMLRRRGGWLGTTSLTLIVVLAILLPTVIYLTLSRLWLTL